MKAIYIDGTPSEVAEVCLKMGWDPGHGVGTVPGMVGETGEATTTPPAAEDGETLWVSVDVARKVLTRKKLSDEQRIVLKAIYDAHPTPVLATELQKITNTRRHSSPG